MTGDARLAIPAAIAWVVTIVAIAEPSRLAATASLAFGIAVIATAWIVWEATHSSAQRAVGPSRMHRTLAALAPIVAMAAAASGLVTVSAVVAEPHRSPPALEEAAEASRFVVLDVTTDQEVSAGSTSWLATIDAARIGDSTLAVSVPVRVVGASVDDRVPLGSTLELGATLMSTEPSDATAFVAFARGEARVTGAPGGILDATSALRAGFRDTAGALPGDGGSLLPGLAIGDTSAVGDDLDSAMKASSLSHLTAVSGANCAIVVGLIMAIGSVIRLSLLARIVIAVVALLGFVVLVTPEPSVLRATVMALTVLVGIASGRASRGLPVLAVAVIALLATDPWLAREYGFVLSVLATAGLLVLAAPIGDVLERIMPRMLAVVLAVPIAAQLACQPVLILLDASVPLYGVLANVLAAPAAPLATVIGLAACLAGPLMQPVATMLAWIAWVPASWIAAVATSVDAAPSNRIEWLSGSTGASALAAVTAVLVASVLALRSPRRPVRVLGVGVVLSCLVIATTATVTSRVRDTVARPHDWTHAACDVGQGDAMVVRSAEHIALIDTGADPALLAECLGTLGVVEIDLLVLTHFDLDHVGGARAVLGRVERVITGPITGAEDDRLLRDFVRAGARVDEVRAGERGRLGDQPWTVLWPPIRATTPPGNDASIVVHWGGGCEACATALYLGDLGEEAQRRLGGATTLPSVDIVKVAHHGSSDQSDELYRTLSAEIALIGVGENDYGHPTSRILEVLENTGSTVARTDTNGLILVSPQSDDALALWTERSDLAEGVDAIDVGDAD